MAFSLDGAFGRLAAALSVLLEALSANGALRADAGDPPGAEPEPVVLLAGRAGSDGADFPFT